MVFGLTFTVGTTVGIIEVIGAAVADGFAVTVGDAVGAVVGVQPQSAAASIIAEMIIAYIRFMFILLIAVSICYAKAIILINGIFITKASKRLQ